jgi:penicillin-binding protein 2
MLEVNAMGEVQRYLGDRPSKAGQDLILTLDLDLQRIAEQSLADKPGGAVVALEASTGAVLALAKQTSFDPNFFSRLIKTAEGNTTRSSTPRRSPLLSRALNPYAPWQYLEAGYGDGRYGVRKVPASTKLVQLPASLTEVVASGITTDVGFGTIGYAEALRFSSNTFFYQVGVGVGSGP